MKKPFDLEISLDDSFVIVSGLYEVFKPAGVIGIPQTSANRIQFDSITTYSGKDILESHLKYIAAEKINHAIYQDFSCFMGWKN